VLIVSHRTEAVTIVTRDSGGWHEREVRAGEAGEMVTLPLHDTSFPVDALYSGIELDVA
jgi:hypothetical protein